MCRALGSIPPGHDQQYDNGRGPPCLNSVHIANPRPSCHKSSRSFFVSSLLCDFPTSHWAQREPQAHGRYAGCSLASEAVASHEQPPQLLNLLRTCYLISPISPISSISHHLHGFLLFFTLSSRVSVMLHIPISDHLAVVRAFLAASSGFSFGRDFCPAHGPSRRVHYSTVLAALRPRSEPLNPKTVEHV